MYKKINKNKLGVIEYFIDREEDLDDIRIDNVDNTVYAVMNSEEKELIYLYSSYAKKWILINDTQKEINSISEQLEHFAKLITPNNGDDITEKLKTLNNGGYIKIFSKLPITVFVNDSILINDNTTIEVSDCITIKKANNVNKPIFKNSNTVDGNENITLIGGVYDFNSSNNTNYDGHGFLFNNVKKLKYKNLTLKNERKYCSLVCNCNDFMAEDITFDTNSDGLHFQPPCKNVTIRDLKGCTHDDMISFTLGDYEAYEVTNEGDFENILIDGVHSDGATAILKLTGSGKDSLYKFRNISLNNVYGSVTQQCLCITNDGGNLINTFVENIDVSNISVKGGANGTFMLGGTVLSAKFTNVDYVGRIYCFRVIGMVKQLIINNVSTNKATTFINGSAFIYVATSNVIEDLLISNADLQFSVGNCKFIDNRGSITNLRCNNVNAFGQTDCILIYTETSTVFENVFFNNFAMSGFTYFTILQCNLTLNFNNCKTQGSFWARNANVNLRINASNCDNGIGIMNDVSAKVSLNSDSIKYGGYLVKLTPQQYDRVICTNTDEPLSKRGLLIYDGTSWVKLA